MTNNTDKALDKILNRATFHPSDIEMDIERAEYAKQAIRQLFLDIVGEDDPDIAGFLEERGVMTPIPKGATDIYRITRNQLRAELREQIDKL